MDNKFNDILIDEAPDNSRHKKIILLVIAAVVLAGILAVYVLTSSNEPKTQNQEQSNSDSQEEPFFQPVDTQPSSTVDDRFAEIIRNIQAREGINPESNEQAQPKEQSPNPQPIESTPLPTPVTKPTQPTQTPTQMSQAPKPTQDTQTPKSQNAPKPNTQPRPQPKPTQDTQTPKSTIDKSKNGQIAQRGHYIQVGNFENTPNKEFLNKIGGYSYRIRPESNGTKYLIGPFSSRTDANRELLKVRTDVGGEAFYYEVK